MQEVSPTTLAKALVSSAIFKRGLPHSELQDPSFAAVFEAVLYACRAITSSDLVADDEKEALLHSVKVGSRRISLMNTKLGTLSHHPFIDGT